jgi:hypothetical protein
MISSTALGLALVGATPLSSKTVSIEVTTKDVSDGGQCCVGACKDSNKNKYFSIADDSGPWLCGETCIRDSFYPVFHIFEKNLTKATDQFTCKDAGYTKYESTVTHGGAGLDCTLDLYSCTKAEGCEHPGAANVGSISSSSTEIQIATFDGVKATSLKWLEQNDPVMGGKSTGTFTADRANKVGVFNGTCAIVPFLKAPGFIKVISSGSTPDVSSCKNFVLNVKSASDYKGFRFSFGSAHYPGKRSFAYGYKSDFEAPVGKFGDVVLPFTGFSDHWNDGTGAPITKCADDPKACPTADSLKKLETLSIWGEGVEGDVHLEVKSIRATGCSAVVV